MPKFGIHFIVLRKVQAALEGSNEPALRDVRRILEDNPFAASLGCIGPDLLFWAPDYGIVEGLRDHVATYDRLKRGWETLREFAETIEKNVTDGVNAVIAELEKLPVVGPVIATAVDYDEAFEKINEAFENLATGFDDDVEQALLVRVLGLDSSGGFERITLARSLFHGQFQSTQQAGREEMDWYWFEMLHYRNTGDFVKALIRNAEASGDEQQMAYAYGYATHYATDLVGHPFVNTISGSPYRMNVQRHVVIENFMDQWKWGREFGGDNIRNTLFKEMGFSVHDDLPLGIATLIETTLKEVYEKLAHPLRYVENTKDDAEAVGIRNDRDGFLEAKDIQTAFTFQKLMLEHLGGQKVQVRPAEPYPGADGDLADLVNSGGVNLPPPPALPGGGLPSNVEELLAAFDAWLSAVSAYVEELMDAARQALDAAVDGLEEFLEDPSQELLDRIRLLAYAIQLMVYNVYRMIHQVLALAGLAYPEPDDASLSNPIAESLITTRQVDAKTQFPILRTPGQPHLDRRSYRPFMTKTNPAFLDRDFENPVTIASHYITENEDTPDGFIDGVALDLELLRAYANAATPAETRDLQTKHPRSFGNAVNISVFILQNRTRSKEKENVVFCNWNLDGDRGYGYKTWDAVPFTVWLGEMEGAIDGNEPLQEVIEQKFTAWTSASEGVANESPLTVYESEVYVGSKEPGSSLLTPLNISDHYIPAMFVQPDRMGLVARNRWINLVPQRFRLQTDTPFDNTFFCNGATTSPSSGIRCTMALQKTLNAAYAGIAPHRFHLKHLHNYSSPEWGDLAMFSDVAEGILGDYLGSMNNSSAIASGDPLREVTNTTQVAVIALLQHGLEKDIPLVLSGHSQGTMITANAVMVFSTFGKAHGDYLRERVKLFHMEPELVVGTRNLLRDLVQEYLVYIMNVADPRGSDLLVEAASGPFPLIPGQPVGLLTSGSGMAALAALMADPNPLDINFYLGLLSVVNGANNDLTALIRYFMTTSMAAHYMPVQLPIIAKDITDDRFRTDPGTLADSTVPLSTGAALNGTSVRVRDFFMTA